MNYPWSSVAKATTYELAEADRLLRQQGVSETKLRQAMLEALAVIKREVAVTALIEALREGNTHQALTQAAHLFAESGFEKLAEALRDRVLESAYTSFKTVPEFSGPKISPGGPGRIGSATIDIGRTNPTVANFLREYPMDLIRGLRLEARQSIQKAIRDGVMAGRNPIDTARDIKQYLGLTPRQTQAVNNYRKYLEGLDRQALDRQLRDRRFDGTIRRALTGEKRLRPDQIDRMVTRYTERYIQHRAQTVARTESIRALNAGNHLLWSKAADDGVIDRDSVTRRWIFTHDDKTRTAHRLVPSMNAAGVGLDEHFQTIDGPLLYPGDPSGPAEATVNCRCTVVYRVKT